MDYFTYKDDERFRANMLTVVYQLNEREIDLASLAVFSNMIMKSNAIYGTKRKLNEQLQKLFGAKMSCFFDKVSGYYLLTFEVLNTSDKFYHGFKSLTDSSMYIMSNIIKHGVSGIEVELEKAKSLIISAQKNAELNPNVRVMNKLFSQIAPDTNLSSPYFGKIEDIEKVTFGSLKTILEAVKVAPKVVTFVGDASLKNCSAAKKYFPDGNPFFPVSAYKIKSNVVSKDDIITGDFSQSSLAIAYSFKPFNSIKGQILSSLANLMIGGDSYSLMFSQIREKEGLCYSINSSYGYKGNYLLVNAGISAVNYEKTLKTIDKIILNVVDYLTPDLLDLAKKSLTRKYENSNNSIISTSNLLTSNQIKGFTFQPIDEIKKIIESVTLQEIKEMLVGTKKLGSCLLRGEKNEKN